MTPAAAALVARALRRDLRAVGFQTVTIHYSNAYPGALATSSYEIGIWRRDADIPSPYAFISRWYSVARHRRRTWRASAGAHFGADAGTQPV
jgi:hypothetical protein